MPLKLRKLTMDGEINATIFILRTEKSTKVLAAHSSVYPRLKHFRKLMR